MSKTNQEKPTTPPPTNPKPDLSTKIDIGNIRNGQHISEAQPKPEKPTKGNK